MFSRARWMSGWCLLAGTYVTLGAIRVIGDGWDGSVLVYLLAATVTVAFAAAMLPIVAPRRPPGDDDGGGGGIRPPDDPPPPPWWPDFEREFWGHVRDRGPDPAPRERTSA